MRSIGELHSVSLGTATKDHLNEKGHDYSRN